MMIEARSCAVIGAGLVGSAAALRLQRAGVSVTLVDPGDNRRAASWGNIGHIATEQVEPHASPANLLGVWPRLFAFGGPVDFRWRDAGLLMPWAARLAQASTRSRFERGHAALAALLRDPIGDWKGLLGPADSAALLAPHGHAVVWMHERAAARGIRSWTSARTGAATVRSLDQKELGAYSAVLRRAPAGGVMFSGTGQVRSPQAVRDAVWRTFRESRGAVHTGAVRRIETSSSGVRLHLEGGDTLDADTVLVAAGAWSGALLAPLGVRAPVIAEWGYSVQSAENRWPADLPTTVFEESALVVSSFLDGLRASSFVEFGATDTAPDPRKWRVIERRLHTLGVPFAEMPDRWRGPRPTLPDYVPAIGRLDHAPRVLYAFGHQHLGLTLAASTAVLVEQLVLNQAPRIDLGPFRIERFA